MAIPGTSTQNYIDNECCYFDGNCGTSKLSYAVPEDFKISIDKGLSYLGKYRGYLYDGYEW